MQFASGKGPAKSTLAISGGAFPQRTFTQANFVPGMILSSPTVTTATSYRCALNVSTAGNDVTEVTVTLQAEPGWSGSASVQMQGAFNRYTTASADWINIGSAMNVTTAGTTVVYQITPFPVYPSYRLVATSTSSAIGIIDWTIVNMFPDLSAEGVGANADYLNGRLGQPSLVVNSSIPYGRETSWVGSGSSVNSAEIEESFTPGGMM